MINISALLGWCNQAKGAKNGATTVTVFVPWMLTIPEQAPISAFKPRPDSNFNTSLRSNV